jgi:hypothetical protein
MPLCFKAPRRRTSPSHSNVSRENSGIRDGGDISSKRTSSGTSAPKQLLLIQSDSPEDVMEGGGGSSGSSSGGGSSITNVKNGGGGPRGWPPFSFFLFFLFYTATEIGVANWIAAYVLTSFPACSSVLPQPVSFTAIQFGRGRTTSSIGWLPILVLCVLCVGAFAKISHSRALAISYPFSF